MGFEGDSERRIKVLLDNVLTLESRNNSSARYHKKKKKREVNQNLAPIFIMAENGQITLSTCAGGNVRVQNNHPEGFTTTHGFQ